MPMRDSSAVRIRLFVVIAVVLAVGLLGLAQERDRARIPDKYKWNLADLYASDAAWRTEKDRMAADLPQLKPFQGRLASSAAVLADALEKMSTLDRTLGRLYLYATSI